MNDTQQVKSGHTPEPWIMEWPSKEGRDRALQEKHGVITIFSKAGGYDIPTDGYIADCYFGMVGSQDVPIERMEANAHRIVTCVNALANVPDPAAAIQAAREALRRIIEETESWGMNGMNCDLCFGTSEDHEEDCAVMDARDALAQLNGGK